jgi:hypothetical protein
MSDYLLITEEKRRAQKRYRCVHCAERIEPGEEHVYTVGTSEGFIQADRWHSECRRVVNEEFFETEYADLDALAKAGLILKDREGRRGPFTLHPLIPEHHQLHGDYNADF